MESKRFSEIAIHGSRQIEVFSRNLRNYLECPECTSEITCEKHIWYESIIFANMHSKGQNGPIDFAERLRTLLNARGWTLTYLSQKSGVSVPHLSHIQNRKRSAKLTTLQRIANAFHIPLWVLLKGVKEED